MMMTTTTTSPKTEHPFFVMFTAFLWARLPHLLGIIIVVRSALAVHIINIGSIGPANNKHWITFITHTTQQRIKENCGKERASERESQNMLFSQILFAWVCVCPCVRVCAAGCCCYFCCVAVQPPISVCSFLFPPASWPNKYELYCSKTRCK